MKIGSKEISREFALLSYLPAIVSLTHEDRVAMTVDVSNAVKKEELGDKWLSIWDKAVEQLTAVRNGTSFEEDLSNIARAVFT